MIRLCNINITLLLLLCIILLSSTSTLFVNSTTILIKEETTCGGEIVKLTTAQLNICYKALNLNISANSPDYYYKYEVVSTTFTQKTYSDSSCTQSAIIPPSFFNYAANGNPVFSSSTIYTSTLDVCVGGVTVAVQSDPNTTYGLPTPNFYFFEISSGANCQKYQQYNIQVSIKPNTCVLSDLMVYKSFSINSTFSPDAVRAGLNCQSFTMDIVSLSNQCSKTHFSMKYFDAVPTFGATISYYYFSSSSLRVTVNGTWSAMVPGYNVELLDPSSLPIGSCIIDNVASVNACTVSYPSFPSQIKIYSTIDFDPAYYVILTPPSITLAVNSITTANLNFTANPDTGATGKFLYNNNAFQCVAFPCSTPTQVPNSAGVPLNLTVYAVKDGMLSKPIYYTTPLPPSIQVTGINLLGITSSYIAVQPIYTGGNGQTTKMKVTYTSSNPLGSDMSGCVHSNSNLQYICNISTPSINVQPYNYYRIAITLEDGYSNGTYRQMYLTEHPIETVIPVAISPNDIVMYSNNTAYPYFSYSIGGATVCSDYVVRQPCTFTGLAVGSAQTIGINYLDNSKAIVGTESVSFKTQTFNGAGMTLGSISSTFLIVNFNTLSVLPVNFTVLNSGNAVPTCQNINNVMNSASCNIPVSYVGFHTLSLVSKSINFESTTTNHYFTNFPAVTVQPSWYQGYTLFTISPVQNVIGLSYGFKLAGAPTTFDYSTNVINLTTTLGTTYNYCANVTQTNIPPTEFRSVCSSFTTAPLGQPSITATPTYNSVSLALSATGGTPSPAATTRFNVSIEGTPSGCWNSASLSCNIASLVSNTSYTVAVTAQNNDQVSSSTKTFRTQPKPFTVTPSISIFTTGFVVNSLATSPSITTQLNTYILFNGVQLCENSLPCVIQGLGAETTHNITAIVYSVVDNTYQMSSAWYTTAKTMNVSLGASQYDNGAVNVSVLSVTGSNPTAPKTYTFIYNGNTICSSNSEICSIPSPASQVIDITVSISNQLDVYGKGFSLSTYIMSQSFTYLALSKKIYFKSVPTISVQAATSRYQFSAPLFILASDLPSFESMVATSELTSYTITSDYVYPGTYNPVTLVSTSQNITTFRTIYAPNGVQLVYLTNQSLVVNYGVSGGAPSTTTYYSVKVNNTVIPHCQNIVSPTCTIEVGIGFFVVSVQATNEVDIVLGSPTYNNVQLTTNVTYVTSSSFEVSYNSNYPFSSYKVLINGVPVTNCAGVGGKCVVTGLTLNTTYNNIILQGYDANSNTFSSAPFNVSTSYPFSLTNIYKINSTDTTATVSFGLIDGGSLPVIFSIYVNGSFYQNTTSRSITVPTQGIPALVKVLAIYYEDQASSTNLISPSDPLSGIITTMGKIDITYAAFKFETNVPLKNVQYTVRLNGAATPLNCQYGSFCNITGLKENSTNSIIVTGNYNNGEWNPTTETSFRTFARIRSLTLSNFTVDSSMTKVLLNANAVGGDLSSTFITIFNGLTRISTSLPFNTQPISVALDKSYPWYQFRAIANYSTSSSISPFVNYVALTFNIISTTTTNNSLSINIQPSYPLDFNLWTLSYQLNGKNYSGCTGAVCIVGDLTPSTEYLVVVTASQPLGKVTGSQVLKTLDTFRIDNIAIRDYSSNWVIVSYPAVGGNPDSPITYAVFLNTDPIASCGASQSYCNITGLSPQTNYNLLVRATRGTENVQNQRSFTLPTGADLTVTANYITTTAASLTYPLRAVISDTPIEYTTTLNGAAVKCNTSDPSCLLSLSPGQNYTFVVSALYSNDKTISATFVFSAYPTISSPQITLVQLSTSVIIVNVTTTGGAPSLPTIQTLSMNGVDTQCNQLCVFTSLSPATTFVFNATVSNDGVTKSTFLPVTTYPIISIASFEPYQRNETGIYVDYTTVGGVPNQSVWTIKVDSQVLCNNTSPPSACYLPITGLNAYNYRLDLSNDGTSLTREYYYQAYPVPAGVLIDTNATDATQSSITFSWSQSVSGGVPGFTYYEAQLSYDNKTWGPACVTPYTNCTVTRLIDNTDYNVRIAVRNKRFDPIVSPQIVLSTQTSGPVTCSSPCLNGGTCQSGYCVCLKGYDGPVCEFSLAGNSTNGGTPEPQEISKVEVNPNNTEVSIQNKYVTLAFSMQSIAEVDVDGVIVEEVDLSTTQWKLVLNNQSTVVHPTSQEQLTELLFGYESADGLVSVNFTQYIPAEGSSASALSVDSYPVTFAGETFNVKLGSLKYSVRVQGWEFNSTENSLYVSSLVGDIGNGTQITFNNGSVMSTLVMVDELGNQVYSRLINRVLVDNFPMRVSHFVTQQSRGTVVTTIIPSFIESFTYDPDLSVLVYSKEETKEDPIDEKSWTGVIVGVTVGVVAAAIIVAGVIYYAKKHKYEIKTFRKRFSRRSIALKEWSRHK